LRNQDNGGIIGNEAVSAIKQYITTLDKVYEKLNDEADQAVVEEFVEEFLISLNENGFMYRRWEK